MMLIRRVPIRAMIALLALATALPGLAQSRVIKPSGTITAKAEKFSTYDIPLSQQGIPFSANPREIEIRSKFGKGTPPVTTSYNQVETVGAMLGSSRTDLKSLFPGIGQTFWIPPDPSIGVGPKHVAQVVNVAIAFFDKTTGVQSFGSTLNTFFNRPLSEFMFDPKVFFDQFSQRYFVVCLALLEGDTKGSDSYIAVSDDSDPNGNWFRYKLNTKLTVDSNDFWLDYPAWGYNRDAILHAGNMFGFESGFQGVSYFVIPKVNILNGGTMSSTLLRDPSAASAQAPRTFDNVGDVGYFTSIFSNDRIEISAIAGIGSAPVLTKTLVSVKPFRFMGAVSSPGFIIDSLGDRVISAAVRNGRLYTAHSAKHPIENKGIVRWYEIDLRGWPKSGNTPIVRQQGDVVAATGVSNFLPAININKFGDISLLYSRVSAVTNPEIVISSRFITDPLNTMGAPSKLRSSEGAYFSYRWGDYFSVEIDPTDDGTFWGVGMVSDSGGGWQTEIRSWQVSGDDTFPKFNFAPKTLSIYLGQGGRSTGGIPEITSEDNKYYSLESKLDVNAGQQAAFETTYEVNKTPDRVRQFRISLGSHAANGKNVSAFIWLWNYKTGRYDLKLRYTPVFTDDNKRVEVLIRRADLPNYYKLEGGVGKVRALTRMNAPYIRQGGVIVSVPSPFVNRNDVLNVVANIEPLP